jgi:hypothetical protein
MLLDCLAMVVLPVFPSVNSKYLLGTYFEICSYHYVCTDLMDCIVLLSLFNFMHQFFHAWLGILLQAGFCVFWHVPSFLECFFAFWHNENISGSSCAFLVLVFFFFFGTRAWTQGLHLEALHQPFFCEGSFEIGSCKLFGLALNLDPPDLCLLSS